MASTSKSPLVHVSSDVLACITGYLMANDILQLLLTGDRALTMQMGPNGGVKELDIAFRQVSDIKWIPVASLFHKLRSFSVHLIQTHFVYLIKDMNLNWLSNGLRVLRLKFPNVFNELLVPPLPFKSAEPNSICYYNLKEQFPLLEELHLEGETTFYEDLMTVLPNNLLELYLIGTMSESIDYTVIKKLPRSLVRLTLNASPIAAMLEAERDFESFGARVQVSFPPNLEKLNIQASWALKVSDCYPPHLTWLSARYAQGNRVLVDFDSLPLHLTYLSTSVGKLLPEDVKKLPRSLEELIVIATGAPELNDEFLRALPPSLTRSNILEGTILGSYRNLPRHLKHLSDMGDGNEQEFKDLPGTLEILDIPGCALNSDKLSQLPRGIQLLGVSLQGPIELASFPSNLRTLRLEPHPASLESLSLLSLPSSLTSLEIPWPFLLPSNGSLLRNLTSLSTIQLLERPSRELQVILEEHQPTLDQFLPPSTTLLATRAWPEMWTHGFKSLPLLSVLNLPAIKADLEFFKSLPPTLTFLTVTSSLSFNRDCLLALPPSLMTCRIFLEQNNLQGPAPVFELIDSDLAALPKTLRSLHLMGTNVITPQSVQYFPFGLSQFQVRTQRGVANYAKRNISPFTPASMRPAP